MNMKSTRGVYAFYFASTSSDHICLAISEHFRKYNWQAAVLCKFSTNSNPFSISHVVLIYLFLLHKWNEISLIPPVHYLERIDLLLFKNPTKYDFRNFG